MKPGAQVSAAIDILQRISEVDRPAELVLRNWGRANRVAGSKDRAAIGQFVFQTLRHRSRCAWRINDDGPRSLIIGYLALSPRERSEWMGWFDGEDHSPSPLTDEERKKIEVGPEQEPTLDQVVSVPAWLMSDFERTFGEEVEAELKALLSRAPIDLRVNSSKCVRKAARAHLKKQEIETRATPYTSYGLRIEAGSSIGARQLIQTKAFESGEVDIQDEGSQLIVEWCDVSEGMQVVDLCAGGGGKTIGLANAMKNKGQIYACDVNKKRLDNIKPRIKRADVRNVQVRQIADWTPTSGEVDPNLGDLSASADLVLVDAPCSGSGAWRRSPDAKWRLSESLLQQYTALQSQILARGAKLVKPGGALVYGTCSLLGPENDDQIAAFLANHPEFQVVEIETEVPVRRTELGLLLSPHKTGTDGYYVSRLRRIS